MRGVGGGTHRGRARARRAWADRSSPTSRRRAAPGRRPRPTRGAARGSRRRCPCTGWRLLGLTGWHDRHVGLRESATVTTPTVTPAQWVAGARPRTLPAAVSPVLAGTGVAAYVDDAVWWKAALALVVAVALQVGVNYANDYSDGIRGTDADRVGPLRLVGSGVASPALGEGCGVRRVRGGDGGRAGARRDHDAGGWCSSARWRSWPRGSTPAARRRTAIARSAR